MRDDFGAINLLIFTIAPCKAPKLNIFALFFVYFFHIRLLLLFFAPHNSYRSFLLSNESEQERKEAKNRSQNEAKKIKSDNFTRSNIE